MTFRPGRQLVAAVLALLGATASVNVQAQQLYPWEEDELEVELVPKSLETLAREADLVALVQVYMEACRRQD